MSDVVFLLRSTRITNNIQMFYDDIVFLRTRDHIAPVFYSKQAANNTNLK